MRWISQSHSRGITVLVGILVTIWSGPRLAQGRAANRVPAGSRYFPDECALAWRQRHRHTGDNQTVRGRFAMPVRRRLAWAEAVRPAE
jgi:hypothetical protein